MARKTAKSLNALLHGVSSDNFHPSDQGALQDVLTEYFTSPDPNSVDSDCVTSSSDKDSDEEPVSIIKRYNRQSLITFKQNLISANMYI